jgi:trimethylamine corrinoid protein
MDEKQLISRIRDSIINFDVEEAQNTAREIVKANIDPIKAIEEGVTPAAKIVGDKFGSGELFLTDLMLAGEAMQLSSNILIEGLSKEKREKLESKRVGTAITATVQGDIHDIGKNILQLLLTVNGFKVTDLGRDVDSMEIVERAKELNIDLIALSALMTTTMPNQKEVIDILKSLGIRENFIVLVGGGSTNKEWADEIGADGWSDTATEAATLAKKLVEEKERK